MHTNSYYSDRLRFSAPRVEYASTERTSRRIVQHIFELLVTVAMRHGMIYMRIRIDDLSFIGDSHTA